MTEFKHLTGQEHPKTSVVYEYPRAEGDPYYPVPRPENAELYKQYQALADATPGRPLRRPAGDVQVLQHGPGRGSGARPVPANRSRRRCRPEAEAGARGSNASRLAANYDVRPLNVRHPHGRSAVTVVMPSFDGASFIRRALSSLLKQTLNDWELVVVDDGSSDRTEEIVRASARRSTLLAGSLDAQPRTWCRPQRRA